MSTIGRNLPEGIQQKGKEIRTFMPKFGNINERRNQLHEVIRLSGMNLVINDTDHPLIIKVASIQSARMQIYFIDNEDYFDRKTTVYDKEGNIFPDNDERAIFFARGVLETVIKLRWAPDIVHCHGWISSLLPLYLKKSFKEDPIFNDSKVVYSIYDDDFPGQLDSKLKDKAIIDGVEDKDLKHIKDKPDFENLSKLAIDMSDGIIYGSEKVNNNLKEYVNKTGLPVLDYKGPEQYIDEYSVFYDKILEEDYANTKK